MRVINEEEKKCGQINVILTSEDNLREINRKYLDRDYDTDIIAFDYSVGDVINGDLFISLERVRENGLTYGEGEEAELRRVMVHGLLHLTGHKDGNEAEKNAMRKKEDSYLKIFRPLN